MARKKEPETEPDGGNDPTNDDPVDDIEKIKTELEATRKAREAEQAELKKLKDEKAKRDKEAEDAKKKADAEARENMTAAERVAEMEKKYETLEAKFSATQSVLDKKVKDEEMREQAEKSGIIGKIVGLNGNLSEDTLMKCDMQFLTQLQKSLGISEAQAVDDQVKKLNEQRDNRIAKLREERRERNKRLNGF